MIRAFVLTLLLIFSAMMVKVWLGSKTMTVGYQTAELRAREKQLSARHAELLYEVNKATSVEGVANRVASLGIGVCPPWEAEAGSNRYDAGTQTGD